MKSEEDVSFYSDASESVVYDYSSSLSDYLLYDSNSLGLEYLPPWSILGTFLISGASFFFRFFLSGVTLVVVLNILELSSMPGYKRAIWSGLFFVGSMLTFFIFGLISFDTIVHS